MADIPRSVQCPYPGFETLAVTYNMMATISQVEDLAASMGKGADHDRSAIVLDMTGWPEDAHPGGPWGQNAPMAVLIWLCRTGYGKAVAEYVNDPFSATA